MSRYVVCEGAAIVRVIYAKSEHEDALEAALEPGQALHSVPSETAPISDLTHEWDEVAGALVPKE